MIYTYNGILLVAETASGNIKGDDISVNSLVELSKICKPELALEDTLKGKRLVIKITPMGNTEVYPIQKTESEVLFGKVEINDVINGLVKMAYKGILTENFKTNMLPKNILNFVGRDKVLRDFITPFIKAEEEEYLVASKYVYQERETDTLSFPLPTDAKIKKDLETAEMLNGTSVDEDDEETGVSISEENLGVVQFQNLVTVPKIAKPYDEVDKVKSPDYSCLLYSYITPMVIDRYLNSEDAVGAYELMDSFRSLLKTHYSNDLIEDGQKFKPLAKSKITTKTLVDFLVSYVYSNNLDLKQIIMGTTNNSYMDIYENELDMYKDLCSFLKKGHPDDFGGEEFKEEAFRKGVLSTYVEEFITDLIYSIVSERYCHSGATLKLIENNEEGVSQTSDTLLVNHGDVDEFIEYLNKSARAVGAQVYAEAIIKMLRWGARKPAILELNGIISTYYDLSTFKVHNKQIKVKKNYIEEDGCIDFLKTLIVQEGKVTGAVIGSNYTVDGDDKVQTDLKVVSIFELHQDFIEEAVLQDIVEEDVIVTDYEISYSNDKLGYKGEYLIDLLDKYPSLDISYLSSIVFASALYQDETDYMEEDLPEVYKLQRITNFISQKLFEYSPVANPDGDDIATVKNVIEDYKFDEVEKFLNDVLKGKSQSASTTTSNEVKSTDKFSSNIKSDIVSEEENIYMAQIIDGSGYEYTLIKAHPQVATDLFYLASTPKGEVILASIDQDVKKNGKSNTLTAACFLLSKALFSGKLYCHETMSVMEKVSPILDSAYEDVKNLNRK